MTPDTAPPTEYTPTTSEVRASYDEVAGSDAMRASRRAEFRRWLSAHDREVAARALRDAAQALEDMGSPVAKKWLRARATRIEAGEADD